MPLKQYSRNFLLEKKNDRFIDFDVLSEIDPNWVFLSYNGKKRIMKLNRSKIKEGPEKKTLMTLPAEASNTVQSKNTTNLSQESTNSRSQLSNSIDVVDLGPNIEIDLKPKPYQLQSGAGIPTPQFVPPSSSSLRFQPFYNVPLSVHSQFTVHDPKMYRPSPIPSASPVTSQPSPISIANHQLTTVPPLNPHSGLYSNPTNPSQSSQYVIPPNGAHNMNPTSSRPHSDPQEKSSVIEDDSLKELRHQFEMRLKNEQELFTMKTKLEWNERENKIRAQNVKALQEIKNKHFKELKKLKAQYFEDLQAKEETMHIEYQKTLEVALSFNGGLAEKENENEEKIAQAVKDLDTIKEMEETLKTSLELNESRVFELNTLNGFLKKRLEEKSNELQATQIAAKGELDTAKKEFQNELKATQLEAKQELDAAKEEFEQMMQLNEMLMTESKDKAWDEIVNILETELECHICTEIFIDADILSTCRHVFCHHCIMRYVRTNAGSAGFYQQQLTCPMCRFPFMERDVQPFPMGRSLVAKIEDKLPEETIQRRIQLKQAHR